MNVLRTGRYWPVSVFNFTVALFLVGFGPPKLVDREVAATVRLSTAELQRWYESALPPTITAEALLVYDIGSGRTLYSRNSDAALRPASLTKLMTALLALQDGRLDMEVEVLAEDLIGGASMGLSAGDVVTVEDLLWGMLVASGNDSAMALARAIGGDLPAFIDKMNAAAEQIGLTNTRFRNPHGLDEDGHVSSASDILTLTMLLLDYPLFREIVSSGETEIAGYSLVNTNEMLGVFPGADGVKTGTTELAGQCLVASITEDGHTVLIIVLGSDDRYGDVAKLYELYQSNYLWVDGGEAELSILNRLFSGDGEIVPLEADGDAPSLLVHRWGDPALLNFRRILEDVEIRPESSAPVGTLEWRAGAEQIAVQDMRVR